MENEESIVKQTNSYKKSKRNKRLNTKTKRNSRLVKRSVQPEITNENDNSENKGFFHNWFSFFE